MIQSTLFVLGFASAVLFQFDATIGATLENPVIRIPPEEHQQSDSWVDQCEVRNGHVQPGGRIVVQQNQKPSLASQLGKARALLNQQQFAATEKFLKSLTSTYPRNTRVHFLLGYSLQAQKKYSQAMKSYRIAAAAPQPNPSVHYNMACICSLQNMTEEAFKHLDAATIAGFKNFGQLAGDADFANIRNDARFKKLIPRAISDDKLFVEPTRIIHKFVGESAGGQFGWTARRVGDWDQDGVIDFVTTAPTHNGAGKVYVYSSKKGKLLFQKQGQAGERFGNSAVGAGDVNNDGIPDLLVGAPNQSAAGNAYVFSGKDGSLIHHFKGSLAGDRFGYEVSELGDLDGDKHADLLVGATVAKGKAGSSGKVFVYSGRTGKLLFELEGERAGDSFGNAAACAADSGKGHTLAIGAQNAGPRKRGRVYVYRIRDAKPTHAFTIEGDSNSVNFGQMFISFPGDINRDGFLDIYASDFSDKTSVRGGGKVIVCSGKDGKTLLTILGKRAGEGLGTSPARRVCGPSR